MKKLYPKLISIFLLSICAFPQMLEAHGHSYATTSNNAVACYNTVPVDMSQPLNYQQRRNFCNVHNRRNCLCLHKVKLGEQFISFSFTDLNNKEWSSSKMLGKPVIILTGHRSRRWEIGKWAECLNKDFRQTGLANVIWVNDLIKSRYHCIRDEQYSMWRAFKSPVPVVFDWDGVVGLSLKVDYSKPNIIVIDQLGRLVMHEIKYFDYGVYASVSGCIKNLCQSQVVCCASIPAYNPPACPILSDLALSSRVVPAGGKKGDSN